MNVVCFGELLLRFSPHLEGQWIKDQAMPVFVGGAELNAANALACWGVPVAYLTALPNHYLSEEVIQHLRSKGINADHILLSKGRIGTYYMPPAADLKSSGVIYDREGSSFAHLQPGQIDWNQVLEGCDWFHFSAISPALNASVAAVCKEAVAAAVAKGIPVSVDLNYRSKLWQWTTKPSETMIELVQQCTVVMGNIWAAEQLLNIPVNPNLIREKKHFLEQANTTTTAIFDAFPKCQYIANTFRFEEEGIRYYATLADRTGMAISGEHSANHYIDKVGSGDTFMAGLIKGIRDGLPMQEVVDFAAAAAFDKLFIKGDSTTSSVDQIKQRITHE